LIKAISHEVLKSNQIFNSILLYFIIYI